MFGGRFGRRCGFGGLDRRLGGFSGGLDVKVALLAVENVHADGATESSRIHPDELRLDL